MSCSADACPAGIDGYYLASELDEYGTTVFTHDPYSTLGDTWRIINTECGWNVEVKMPDQEDWSPYATTQCSECTDSCRTLDALTTDETSVSGVSLALGNYEGGTFTPLVQEPPPPPPPQLAVIVSVFGFGILGMDGVYLASELDEDEEGTPVFAKDEVTILGTTWRIRNTECGWKIEEDDGGWKPRAITYNGYYKENCGACTGSCKTIDALTTSEVYGDNGETDASEPLSGVSLTLVAA